MWIFIYKIKKGIITNAFGGLGFGIKNEDFSGYKTFMVLTTLVLSGVMILSL